MCRPARKSRRLRPIDRLLRIGARYGIPNTVSSAKNPSGGDRGPDLCLGALAPVSRRCRVRKGILTHQSHVQRAISIRLCMGPTLGPSGGPFGTSEAVSCAGSTKVLTATNQEVARSSRAGRTKILRKNPSSSNRSAAGLIADCSGFYWGLGGRRGDDRGLRRPEFPHPSGFAIVDKTSSGTRERARTCRARLRRLPRATTSTRRH